MMLLFSYGVGVTQPKASDLGGESLAEREQIKLTAPSSFTRTVSKDVLELMMWEPAQCELLRLGIFQRLISMKICGVAAIFGHGQNVYACYTCNPINTQGKPKAWYFCLFIRRYML